jgi:hypothetical protein
MVRAQGPFAHPIIAGTLAAGLLPLFLGSFWGGESKTSGMIGAIGTTIMSVTAASSTAMAAWVAGIGALLMWPLRGYLKWFRIGTVILLVSLHLVMHAPVWALIARIDLVGGSSSYHRFELINQAILHFFDWYLIGEKTTYQWGFNLWDTANTYVEVAVTGGISTLILLMAIVVTCFKRIGVATRRLSARPAYRRMVWSMGAALFANLIGFIGITYYDQSSIAWYTLLALICSATVSTEAPGTEVPPQVGRDIALSREPSMLEPYEVPGATVGSWNHF